MNLYKYTNATIGLEILRNSELRYSQLGSLNDPFESHLPINNCYTNIAIEIISRNSIFENNDLLNGVIDDIMENMYSKLPNELTKSTPKHIVKEYIYEQINKELETKGKTLRDFLKEAIVAAKDLIITDIKDKAINLVSTNICALSFSENPDNEVMWSHYADSHRGMLLGFNTADPFFKDLFKIKYQKERPIYDFSINPIDEIDPSILRQSIFGIKNEAWSYEREYRIIEPQMNLKDTGKHDHRGFSIFVKSFPSSILYSVAVGCNFPIEMEQSLIDELKMDKYRHVKIFREYLDKSNNNISLINYKSSLRA